MFERYTEAARRTLFFARYEASRMGMLSIESEHVLLGIVKAATGPAQRIFEQARLSRESVRQALHPLEGVREKISTSVEIPFSEETKRVLQYAAEEADGLLHSYIGTEHLLLGLLREPGCTAASILNHHGLSLEITRAAVVRLLDEARRGSSDTVGERLEPDERIDRIRQRIDELGALAGTRVRDLIAEIRRDLDELKRRF